MDSLTANVFYLKTDEDKYILVQRFLLGPFQKFVKVVPGTFSFKTSYPDSFKRTVELGAKVPDEYYQYTVKKTDKYVEFTAQNEVAMRKAFVDYMSKQHPDKNWWLTRTWEHRPYVKEKEEDDVNVPITSLFDVNEDGDGY